MDLKAKSTFPQVGKTRQRSSPDSDTNSTAVKSGTSITPTAAGTTDGGILQPPQIASLGSSTPSTGKGGGALRSIDANFEVNPADGSFTLSIPLPVSKSRKDFQPSLSLSYASSSGNGAFGIGWHVSLEAVTRKTSKQIPKYDESDVFLLSGSDDLVPLRGAIEHSVNGYFVKRFSPRIDNDNLKIERWTNQNDSGDIHWRTISSSNIIKIYGRDASSRVADTSSRGSSSRRIYSWLLSESYDPYGNAMVFSYKAENKQGLDQLPAQLQVCEQSKDATALDGLKYIKSVKYGNRRPARDLESWELIPSLKDMEWLFEVVFDYGEHDVNMPTSAGEMPWKVRSDIYSTCSPGFELRSYRLCRRMLMFHHVPDLKLAKQEDYLVLSTTFDYNEAPTGTYLASISQNGHIWNKVDRYDVQTLPPCEFIYETLPDLSKSQVRKTKPRTLQNLFAQRPDTKAQWTDLDGEGSSGILVQYNGAWYYERNENAARASVDDDDSGIDIVDDFGPIKILELQPSCQSPSMTTLGDLDGNGCQDVVISDEYGRAVGYHEKTHHGAQWTAFKAFPAALNKPSGYGDVRMFDVTGNGLQDIVESSRETHEMIWHESLAKLGFSEEKRALCAGTAPQFLDSNPCQASRIADMTGDGLADIVNISNGRISYWPSLGYARFGTEVVMNNSPIFESDEVFNVDRLLLIDVDGSGTTDLVYLSSSEGATLYRNYCGNGWSDGALIPAFPKMDSLASVFALDLLGKGTSCLCWLGLEEDGTSEAVIRYIDLASGTKPHLINSIKNSSGLETSISYSPSTSFFLKDERERRPWRTKLPFPVHVVRKVVKNDLVAQTSYCAKYVYHDGHFDGREREFRGFGMVEQYENDTYPMINGKTYKTPTRHRKMWFYSGSSEVGLAGSRTFGEAKIHTKLPSDLSTFCDLETFRALKAMPFRNEVYELSTAAMTTAPLFINETSYEVHLVQKPLDSAEVGIAKVFSRETLTTAFDRYGGDRRVNHVLFLERNAFGDVTKSVTAQYGREKSDLQDVESQKLQCMSIFRCTNTAYTNALGHNTTGYKPYFYKPLVAEVRETHLQGISSSELLEFETVAKEDFDSYAIYDSRTPDVNNKSRKTRTPGKASRILFRSQDLTKVLDPFVIEPFSVVDQTFEFVMDDSLRFQVYGPDDKLYLSQSSKQLRTEGAFKVDGNGSSWQPSSRSYFGTSTNKAMQLSAARQSFFSPTITMDPFDNQSAVQMDEFWLFAQNWINPLGDETISINDYRASKATTLVDLNLNRTQVLVDGFGGTTASAKMGKEVEDVGDSLDGLTEIVDPASLLQLLENPTKTFASQLLGEAGSRVLECRLRVISPSSNVLLPTFSVCLTRSQHAKGEIGPEPSGKIGLAVTYYDGRLNPIQVASLHHWEAGEDQWHMSGLSVVSWDGNGLQSCHPFFASKSTFIPYQDVQTQRSLTFVDAMARPIATFNPDRTWSKTRHKPWSRHEFDIGDTLLIENLVEDPDVGSYLSTLAKDLLPISWYKNHRAGSKLGAEAAEKSVTYANAPRIVHLDAGERIIVGIEKSGPNERSGGLRYDFDGGKVKEIDTLGRTVQQSIFDQLGRAISTTTLDAGTKTTFYDCAGKTMLSYHDSGVSRQNVYDKLGRNVETWVQERGGSKYLWSRSVYCNKSGNVATEAEAVSKNQRGNVVKQYSQAGLKTADKFDFKGNCISSTNRFAAEYRSTFNCTQDMELEDKLFTSVQHFDAQNRGYKSMDALGRITLRDYNQLGALSEVKTSLDGALWSSCITSIDYAADGSTTRVKFGNNSQTIYAYDEVTRELLNKKTWREDGKVLEDQKYSYDVLGHVSHIDDDAHQDMYFRNKKVDTSKDYTYDKFGRLLRATGRTMVDTSKPGTWVPDSLKGNILPEDGDRLTRYLETYTYDETDNILSMSRKSADTTTADWTRTYQYDDRASNKLSSTSFGKGDDEKERYRYDNAGCLISVSGYSSLQWDSFNRLKSSSKQKVNNGIPETTYFVYDAAGKRVRKITERASTDTNSAGTMLKETLYLPTCELDRAFKGDGITLKHEIRTSHVMEEVDSDSPLVLIESEPAKGKPELVRYSLNPGLEVDDKGKVVSYEEYSPFGMTTFRACGTDIEAPSSFRFAAYLRDTETGLDYCRARYYAPWIGRWTAPDPLGTADGPNLYVYCGNDPVNYTDPQGTMRASHHVVPIVSNDPNPQPAAPGNNQPSRLKTVGKAVGKALATAFCYVVPPAGRDTLKNGIAAAVNGYANAQISSHPPEEVLPVSIIAYLAAGMVITTANAIVDTVYASAVPDPVEEQVEELGKDMKVMKRKMNVVEKNIDKIKDEVETLGTNTANAIDSAISTAIGKAATSVDNKLDPLRTDVAELRQTQAANQLENRDATNDILARLADMGRRLQSSEDRVGVLEAKLSAQSDQIAVLGQRTASLEKDLEFEKSKAHNLQNPPPYSVEDNQEFSLV